MTKTNPTAVIVSKKRLTNNILGGASAAKIK